MKHIDKIVVQQIVDTDPDLSHLGEYANSPGPDDKTIDREERGDMLRGEYRYWVATMSGEETGNPDSVEQDYQRAEDYNKQQWCMMGVRAVATININGTIQKISSGGLWGIESDSDDDYFREVAEEELADLRSQLIELGFSKSAITKSMPSKPLKLVYA